MSVNTDLIPALRPLETIPIEENGRPYLLLRDPYGYTEKMIAVARHAAPLLALMDGSRPAEQIASEYEAMTGVPVDRKELDALVKLLTESYLLETPKFQELRVRLEREYHALRQRPPALAGTGYPDTQDELVRFLDKLLDAPPDEDRDPEKPLTRKRIRGVLLPHIDFQRGGLTYGRGYRESLSFIDDLKDPILLGVIGVAHQGAGYPIVAASKEFLTPFGALKSDDRALQVIRQRLGEKPFISEWAHRSEHSVELQVVWLQHLLAKHKVTLLPLASGIISPASSGTPRGDRDVEDVVETLKEIEAGHAGSILWVASVDFAHLGPYFGDDDPVDDRLKTETARLDMEALGMVRKADADGWWRSVMKDDNRRRVCGLNATYIFLRMLEGTHGSVLDYQQAVSPSADQMVSFAAAMLQEA